MSVAQRADGLATGQTLVGRLRRVVRVPSRRSTNASRPRPNVQPVRASQATTTLTLKPLDASYEDTHSFASFSNWIIPEHLMVGRYPYVEPGELKKCATHAVGEEQLKKILETGIRTFVSLQSDVMAQNEMPLGGDKGFLPYKQPVELIAEAMAGPPPKESFFGLRNPFIDKFLPKKHNAEGEESVAPLMECKFVHHPIKGMKTLTVEDLDPALTDLSGRLNSGEKVYMHCWGGRGRAGIVTCCLLARMFNLSAEECIERVSRGFYTRHDDSYPSALSDEQITFVHSFVKHLNA